MAPPPEYDKEPKAPDKSATNITCEETKTLHNTVVDQQTNSDNKSASTTASTEVENKLIETLDDGQLRALLDEAITYKCPKDREGKSNLFKELLEEVEQDEQASEAAARSLNPGRAAVTRAHAVTTGRGSRSRRALPHSNSLQDLVAALAAEPAPRRHHRAPPAPAPAPVSTRAIHGGSLPSGVDTSFLLGEEPARGAGYLATVRCVNPPPLAERRVSTDANCSSELESLTRRSKPAFPMTYTARATLEIGSGAVCSGRAVTTTTASNQVRTRRYPRPAHFGPTTGPPERLYQYQSRLYIPTKYKKKNKCHANFNNSDKNTDEKKMGFDKDESSEIKIKLNKKETSNDINMPKENTFIEINVTRKEIKELSIDKDDETELDYIIQDNMDSNQSKLISALFPKVKRDRPKKNGGGNTKEDNINKGKTPRGPQPIKELEVEPNKNEEKHIISEPVTILKNKSNKKLKMPTIEAKTLNKELQKTAATPKNLRQEKSTGSASVTILNNEVRKEVKISAHKKITENASIPPEKSLLGEQKNTAFNNKKKIEKKIKRENDNNKLTSDSYVWKTNINSWYEGLGNYSVDASYHEEPNSLYQDMFQKDITKTYNRYNQNVYNNGGQYSHDVEKTQQRHKREDSSNVSSNSCFQNVVSGDGIIYNWSELCANPNNKPKSMPLKGAINMKEKSKTGINKGIAPFKAHKNKTRNENVCRKPENFYPVDTKNNFSSDYDYYDLQDQSRREYRERIGNFLAPPNLNSINPRNVRKMTIGKPLSHFVEFGDKITDSNKNEKRDNGADDAEKMSSEISAATRNINKSGLQNKLLSSSDDTMNEDLKEDDMFGDISLNSTVKSSTPIPEQNDTLAAEESDAICQSVKNTEVSSENISKLEDIFPTTNHEQVKGTVIPVVSQSGHIITSTNEDLCSFSSEKQRLLEVNFVRQPPEDKNIKSNVENSNVLCNQENDFELDLNNENKDTLVFNTKEQEKQRKSDVSRVNDDVVELVDMSSQNQKKYESSDQCEDTTFMEYFSQRKQIQQSEEAIFDNDIELDDMSSSSHKVECVSQEVNDERTKSLASLEICQGASFLKYLAKQEKLFQALADSNLVDSKHSLVSSLDSSEKVHNIVKDELSKCANESNVMESQNESYENVQNASYSVQKYSNVFDLAANYKMLVLTRSANGPVVLTLPYSLFSNECSVDQLSSFTIEYGNNTEVDKVQTSSTNILNRNNQKNNSKNSGKLKSKKKNVCLEQRKLEIAKKKALKAIMFENSSESRRQDKSISTSMSTVSIKEVDSAIPFSCITTPEVVASCNTTSSTSQSAVAVDTKPLQLASSYRAVASLVGEAPRAASPARPAASPPPPPHRPPDQARGVVATSFNGLPLTRPGYGSTGTTQQEEYKKSIDENGNSVQGFSSPLSGSSQHKKPRRKKSSKNETVIKSHQIDGYQGNKDLNEVLRFIESAADTTRAGKLGRAKHRDDADDKGGKKRTGTRKDKETKMKRATSMEELSCSRMEDLTDKPCVPARAPRHSDQAKAERRSWGDDAREAATRFFREEPVDVPVVPDTEFQTVTKRRKPRRPPGDPDPPPHRPPEPRARRVSAPPSDRSNDSNDDMDSVHSLPADAAGGRTTSVPAPISYADIARTRHNIPDLIESCNFYVEGERDRGTCAVSVVSAVSCNGVGGGGGGGGGALAEYPALEPRARAPRPAHKHAPAARKDRKVERAESVPLPRVTCPDGAEWPAPDVVADRRPAVILLDAAAPRDMDGVTFGFDINETLLGGEARRPRCDLVLDALEGASPPAPAPPAGGEGGCGALRYEPPAPLALTHNLTQIIDYVSAAWEDVVRLGAGKVHYFSE